MAYEIFYSPEFQKDYKKLAKNLQERLKERGKLFQENPFHPILRTHKLGGFVPDCWAFSLDFRHRILFEFAGKNHINLLRVGDHSIYAKMPKKR